MVTYAGGKASYSGPGGIDVPCRPTLIRRAVACVIDNAVKYGCGARVRIVRDSDRVVIVDDDDGSGIPVEELEKVFAPFDRWEAARDPGKAGVGLGLSIARTVAREHGGDVDAQEPRQWWAERSDRGASVDRCIAAAGCFEAIRAGALIRETHYT
jgi:K+-sensing histidine kinase KdpD